MKQLILRYKYHHTTIHFNLKTASKILLAICNTGHYYLEDKEPGSKRPGFLIPK